MHQVIILAGGKDRHGWTVEHPKVMALVEGVPVVLRVVRQVAALGLKAIVLTWRKNVQKIVPDYYVPPRPHGLRPIGGLLDSALLWRGERVTLLCGDTVYPPEVLEAILSDKAPLSVWGDRAEVYGIAFAAGQFKRVRAAIDRAMPFEPTLVKYGLLWQFYRAVCERQNLRHHAFEDVIFKHIQKDTYIRDFDTTVKYASWLRNHPWAA